MSRAALRAATAAAVFAWAAAGAAPTGASAPQWGAPAASASAPSAEDDDDRATGEYFHDFAALMVRLRSVGWLADICGEAFPADAALERRAYEDWRQAHRAFVDEMEGQFALIDRRWAGAPGVTTAALRSKLDGNRAALREDFLARPVVVQRKRCEAYPTLLLSRALDLEKSQPDLVRSVRRGPPAP